MEKKSLTIAKKKVDGQKSAKKTRQERLSEGKKNWVTKNLSILIIDQINTSDKFDLNE